MPWLISNWRVIAVATALTLAMATGWSINGWRWESKHQALLTAHAEAQTKAEQQARAKERDFQAAADKERNARDEKIRTLNAALNSSLAELRKRTSRPASLDAAGDSKTAATGRELYREDAEFLIREAARADAVMAEWQACYATYEAIRQQSK